MKSPQPIATIRASRTAIALAVIASLGSLAFGISGVYAYAIGADVSWRNLAIAFAAILGPAALPYYFRYLVGVTLKLHAGRLELRAPFEPRRLIGTSQVLGWGHDYTAETNPRTGEVRYDAGRILLFTTRGTFKLGGVAAEGEREMRRAIAERFTFCNLEGYTGSTDYPPVTKQKAAIDPAYERVGYKWARRLGGGALVAFGLSTIAGQAVGYLSASTRSGPQVHEIRARVSFDPRIITGGSWRPNAFVLRVEAPDSLAFVLSTSEFAAAKRTELRRLRAGDSIVRQCYADDLYGDARFRYAANREEAKHNSGSPSIPREYGKRAIPPVSIEVGDRLVFRTTRANPLDSEPDLGSVLVVGIFGVVIVVQGVKLFRSAGPLTRFNAANRSRNRVGG